MSVLRKRFCKRKWLRCCSSPAARETQLWAFFPLFCPSREITAMSPTNAATLNKEGVVLDSALRLRRTVKGLPCCATALCCDLSRESCLMLYKMPFAHWANKSLSKKYLLSFQRFVSFCNCFFKSFTIFFFFFWTGPVHSAKTFEIHIIVLLSIRFFSPSRYNCLSHLIIIKLTLKISKITKQRFFLSYTEIINRLSHLGLLLEESMPWPVN